MTRQQPMLMQSPLSKRVYVVTSYVDEGDGLFTARQKFDVTEQFEALAAMRRGECELEIKDNMDESEGTGAVWWECSSCHWQIEFFHTKWLEHAKFCPECGAFFKEYDEMRGDAE